MMGCVFLSGFDIGCCIALFIERSVFESYRLVEVFSVILLSVGVIG